MLRHRARQNSSEGIQMCVEAQSVSKSKGILTCVEAQNTSESSEGILTFCCHLFVQFLTWEDLGLFGKRK